MWWRGDGNGWVEMRKSIYTESTDFFEMLDGFKGDSRQYRG